MKTLTSALENQVYEFELTRDVLQQNQFTLGGNWDYDHGYFDRSLDEANQVWLRIPFQVTTGRLESENSSSPDTNVRVGTPFVLKHLYNDGLDPNADTGVYSALFNQFQEPVDKDASIEGHWVQQAIQILHNVEKGFV